MEIALALTGMALLGVALVLFLRSSRGGAAGNRRAIILLLLLGLTFALASQLPLFRG